MSKNNDRPVLYVLLTCVLESFKMFKPREIPNCFVFQSASTNMEEAGCMTYTAASH